LTNKAIADSAVRHFHSDLRKGFVMGLILLIVLIMLCIGAMPRWGYSSGWGYQPSGALGIVLVVVVVLMLMGHIPHSF
jgi:Protein of unknown function (DUF3309)